MDKAASRIRLLPTSQNYELSAQGNLWLEILEF